MKLDGHRWAEMVYSVGGFGPGAKSFGPSVIATLTFDRWIDALPLILSGVALVAGGIAIFFAFRARQLAHSALQEAGEAKARAQASGPPLSTEALAAAERVWTARLNAIEAQIQSNLSRPPKNPNSHESQQFIDLAVRIAEIERSVHGLTVLVAQGRRSGSTTAPQPALEVKWPAALNLEKPGVKELRDLLQEGAKNAPGDLERLFQKLDAADGWTAKRRPSTAELLSFLADVSQSFNAVLRNGALLPAHEVSRMSDRFAALLRPLWQKFHPEIDCRIFYPGAPFDPEWMEDLNSGGLRRPTISDIYSWAVHEKDASGRRLIAKSRVTTE